MTKYKQMKKTKQNESKSRDKQMTRIYPA